MFIFHTNFQTGEMEQREMILCPKAHKTKKAKRCHMLRWMSRQGRYRRTRRRATKSRKVGPIAIYLTPERRKETTQNGAAVCSSLQEIPMISSLDYKFLVEVGAGRVPAKDPWHLYPILVSGNSICFQAPTLVLDWQASFRRAGGDSTYPYPTLFWASLTCDAKSLAQAAEVPLTEATFS